MALFVVTADAQSGKPNILAIMTDDLDIWNISAYQPIRPFSPVD